MQAIRYRLSVPRFLLARALGPYLPSLYDGPFSCLELAEIPEPPLRGPAWLRLRPLYAGICGTDMGTITGKNSPALAPFVSLPAVLGHEVVARVTELGPEAQQDATGQPLQVGDRVVVDPAISCTVRGRAPCPACAEGRPYLCRYSAGQEAGAAPPSEPNAGTPADSAPLPAGMIIGFCRDLPGGWSEAMVAHQSQVYRVPDGLSDERAVLVEPLAVALHAVLRRPPLPGARVLVLGGGAIGLCQVAALRLLDLPCHITVVARYPFQAEAAERLGADVVYGGWRRGDALQAACDLTEAEAYQPPLGRQVLVGGFDWTYDCVGTGSSLDDALRATRPGGTVVVVGAASLAPQADWTFIWSRELDVLGSAGYGRERYAGEELHTFAYVLRLLAQRPDYPLESLVTHKFPLHRYREALRVNLDRRRHQAIKVVLYPE